MNWCPADFPCDCSDLIIHICKHRSKVVHDPPLQYFLYKFSYLVENRSHDLGKQACKLRNYRLCHNYNTATRHELLDPL